MEEMLIGVVDRTIPIFISDPASTDGSGAVGLVAANLTVSYTRFETDNDVVVVDVTSSLNNLSALTDAHNDWGLLQVSATLAPGQYRLDVADAVWAAGAWYAVIQVTITSSLASATPKAFRLVAVNALDGVRHGLTALPNAAADGAGGLPISDAGGLDLDAKLANTNEVTAARMGALTDWINGGRLDLILDIIAADTTTDIPALIGTPAGASVSADIAAIEAQTDDIGVNGAGLSAIPIVPANVTQISGDGPAADALETMLDGSGGNSLTLTQLDINNPTGSAIVAVGGSGGTGIYAKGDGTAPGIWGDGGATGPGIQGTGGATSGDGIRGVAQTLGDGMELVGAGGGVDLNSDLPWTASWDAEVQSEVTDALNAYDPPTRTEATADKDEILTQLPAAPPKNAIFGYGIKMVDSTDHATPETGLIITMTRSLDGAAFGAATGTILELTNGHYWVTASAADMNGDVVMHRFTAAGADDLTMEFKTVS